MINDLKTITILFRAQHAIERYIRSDIERYGLNTTEFGVLEVLYHKGALPVKTILEKILIAPSSLSYVLGRLEKKAFITKTKQKSDNRSYLVALTEKGKSMFSDIYEEHRIRMRNKLNVLSHADEMALRTLLKKLGKQ